jgi:hypothetical protein
MPLELLQESGPLTLELVESESKGGNLRVRGEFARAGVATENKRLYPKMLWEREIGRLTPGFSERRVFGELDHPDDGKTKLSRVSHIVTNLNIKDGIVVGEAEILPTARGKDLAALLRSGCRVGVSSRGYGSTKPNAQGDDVVQEDYRLLTFDFVADPADRTAYPDLVSESLIEEGGLLLFEGLEFLGEDDEGDEGDEGDEALDDADDDADDSDDSLGEGGDSVSADDASTSDADGAKETAEELEKRLRKEFSEAMVTRMAIIRRQVEAQVRTELEGTDEDEDQDAVIERLSMQVEELETRVAELEEDNELLEATARAMGFQCFLERELANDPDADKIRRLVGDVRQYENAEEFKHNLGSIREEIARVRQEEAKERESRRRVYDRMMEDQKRAQAHARKLEEALGKSLAALKETGVQLYGERRLKHHPKAGQIRSLLESGNFSSPDEVDRLIEQFRPPKRGMEEIDRTSARIRNAVGGGFRGTPLDEEEPWPKTGRGRSRRSEPRALKEGNEAGYNGLGVDLGELQDLMPPGANRN